MDQSANPPAFTDRTVRIFAHGPESEDALLEESLLHWRALGPSAAWQAMFDLLDWWFVSRNLDPDIQRVDRTHVEIHRVPWLTLAPEPDGDA